ncbi:MAG: hypothetical protein KJZ86_12850 [Caldilineaceae bacterium]|mgnify:CR=1 FL=1|nr:hypothetical protein [Caldilineaceae bacterium]HRJ41824.1 hypothetical protein [Caldilineaceae bacterium]
MTFRLSTEKTPSPPSRTWLQLLLWTGFLLSLLIGLLALAGVYLLPDLEEETALVATDPLLLVEPARIPPHLALLQLAGAESDALVRQAATAGESTLAYSILLYDGTLTPSRQASELLRVGRQFLAQKDQLRAVAAFERARAAALFALPMPPLERGQLLARAADGLWQAGNGNGALETGLQAQHVAAQAAGLLPAQRGQILQAVLPILRSQGSPEQIQQLNELLAAPGQTPERVTPISRLAQLRQEYPSPALLTDLRNQRIEAARMLIDRLLLTSGQDIDLERAALADALRAEDRLRTEIYGGWNDSALQLAQRHELLLDYRNWLLVKAQVAEGGFGLRLVEEWEGQQEAIRQSLGWVMGEMNALLSAQVAEDPDPLSQAVLRLETLQWLAFQAELGFYPHAPLGELSSQMERTQAELERVNSPPDLPLFYDGGASPAGFRIARRYE